MRRCALAPPTAPRRRARGFTLVEVMLAVSLLAVIGAIVVGTLHNTLRARDLLAADDAVQQSARVVLSRLERELRLAYLTPHVQAVNTFHTIFVAQDGDPVDTLWFTTLSHHRLYRGRHECDETEITIWAEDDPENPHLAVLLHREAERIDGEPDQGGVILPLAHGVKRFDTWYLDGELGEWREDWDTLGTETPNRLPRAVKLVLVLSVPDVEDPSTLVDHSFFTTILLDYASAMKRSLFARGQQGGQQ